MTSEGAAEPVRAYVGLGSNLNDPAAQVRRACGELAGIAGTRLVACSRLYRTVPVGPQDQPDYVNAAACVETALPAEDLLAALQALERSHGRVRDGTRWGPRILDLDILLYGEAVIDRPGLHVPHPEMVNRAFVLIPLAEVAPPDLRIPGGDTLAAALACCARSGVIPLDREEGEA